MVVITNDTMADTVGVLLHNHVVTGVGGPWKRNSTAPNATWRRAANGFYPNDLDTTSGSTPPSIMYVDDVPATAEYDIEVDYRYIDDFGNAGPFGRGSATAYTGYHFYHQSGSWILTKWVAGLSTNLGVVPAALVGGTVYRLKMELRDAAKKMYVDGGLVITSTDNQITSKGYAGLRSAFQYGDAEGKQFSNFLVTDLSVAEEARLGAIIIGD